MSIQYFRYKIIKAGINIYKVRYKDSGSVYNR